MFFLTDQEQCLLLEATEDSPRDHLIFLLALTTGLRVGEIAGLNVGDLVGTKVVDLRPEITKGKRGGKVVISDDVQAKIYQFLAWKVDQGQSVSPGAPLFCSRGGGRSKAKSGDRLSKHAMQIAFKVWQQKAGFTRHHRFHNLRYTFCRNLWLAIGGGGDLSVVQAAARHCYVGSTVDYVMGPPRKLPSVEKWLKVGNILPDCLGAI